MPTNAWGDPMPEQLDGAQGEAWALVMLNNEWFDGEDAIAYSAQQRFLREWADNGPATVTTIAYRDGFKATRSFATIREAYAYAVEVEGNEHHAAYVKAD